MKQRANNSENLKIIITKKPLPSKSSDRNQFVAGSQKRNVFLVSALLRIKSCSVRDAFVEVPFVTGGGKH